MDDMKIVHRQLAQYDRRMGGQKILTGPVGLEVLQEAGDAMRFQAEFNFIKQGYVRRTKGLFLQARRQHAF
jgi:hypothetical protein